jgi:two-component system alkaline phosphatase synthesis response regulator PhoP
MGNKTIIKDKSKILLVEDEETLAAGLQFNLIQEGYQVVWARNGTEAIEQFGSQEFDLIVLDIMLPFMDGFEIARRIRETSPQIPILVLTARSHSKDKIRGLELGIDDYVTKPFHLQELLLRIAGMLKRKTWYKSFTQIPAIYKFGNNTLNFENYSLRNGEKNFQLTSQEAMILKYLIEHKGVVVTRKDLLKNVWNVKSDLETRTVDNFIARLRKYIEDNPSRPKYIKSVRSVGYMFSDGDE